MQPWSDGGCLLFTLLILDPPTVCVVKARLDAAVGWRYVLIGLLNDCLKISLVMVLL